MKKLIFTILLAAVLWTVMFSPWTAPFVNFWWMMTGFPSLLLRIRVVQSLTLISIAPVFSSKRHTSRPPR